MTVRILPEDIDIPEATPFQHDLFDRKQHVEILTSVIHNISGPCTISIDGAWGEGKTTFLRLCRQHMQNEGFPVVSFNAWETDYSGDPFIALSEELSSGLAVYTTRNLRPKLEAFGKSTLEVMKRSITPLIRIGTAGVLDVSPLIEAEIGNALASFAEHRLSTYRGMHQSMEDFKSDLRAIARTLAESREQRPLVVIIDELDRCRPSYAVELLEVAKHLFSVEHVVFLLALNRSQLAHSICAVYGNDFGANEYLRRFFNVEYRLPSPGIQTFTDKLLSEPPTSSDLRREALPIFAFFFGGEHVSKRSIAQAIQHFKLVSSLSSDRQTPHISTVAIALVIRTLDSDLYYRFLGNEVTDVDVVETIYRLIGRDRLTDRYPESLFESTLISARINISESKSSELHNKYDTMLQDRNDLGHFEQHISNILSRGESQIAYTRFKEATELLELTSSFLVSES